MWDLRGKADGLNIAASIGQARTAVPAYASAGLWLDRSVDELQAEARSLLCYDSLGGLTLNDLEPGVDRLWRPASVRLR